LVGCKKLKLILVETVQPTQTLGRFHPENGAKRAISQNAGIDRALFKSFEYAPPQRLLPLKIRRVHNNSFSDPSKASVRPAGQFVK